MASRQSALVQQAYPFPPQGQDEQQQNTNQRQMAFAMRPSTADDASMCGTGDGQQDEPSTSRVNSPQGPQSELVTMGRLYLTWCHGQPVTLFNADTFLESLPFRDKELILALQTFSLRFPPSDLTPQRRERLDGMEREARSIVMGKIADAEVEISTLQALCILSMVEFASKFHKTTVDMLDACLYYEQMVKWPRRD